MVSWSHAADDQRHTIIFEFGALAHPAGNAFPKSNLGDDGGFSVDRRLQAADRVEGARRTGALRFCQFIPVDLAGIGFVAVRARIAAGRARHQQKRFPMHLGFEYVLLAVGAHELSVGRNKN